MTYQGIKTGKIHCCCKIQVLGKAFDLECVILAGCTDMNKIAFAYLIRHVIRQDYLVILKIIELFRESIEICRS